MSLNNVSYVTWCDNKLSNQIKSNQSNKRITYSVFHRFKQATFAYGDLILSSSQFFVTSPAASINDAYHKSSQNWLKNNHHSSTIKNRWNRLYFWKSGQLLEWRKMSISSFYTNNECLRFRHWPRLYMLFPFMATKITTLHQKRIRRWAMWTFEVLI